MLKKIHWLKKQKLEKTFVSLYSSLTSFEKCGFKFTQIAFLFFAIILDYYKGKKNSTISPWPSKGNNDSTLTGNFSCAHVDWQTAFRLRLSFNHL